MFLVRISAVLTSHRRYARSPKAYFAIVGCLLVFAACSPQPSETAEEQPLEVCAKAPGKCPGEEPANYESPPAAPLRAGLNDTLTLTGWNGERVEITPLEVVDPAEFTGCGPASENHFVAVRLRVLNVGDQTYRSEARPFPFGVARLIDNADLFHDAIDCPTRKPEFPEEVVLKPGQTAEGYGTFELGDGYKPSRLSLQLGDISTRQEWRTS